MMEAGLETDGASVLYHTLEENENEQEKQIQRSATLSHEKVSFNNNFCCIINLIINSMS